MPEVIELLRAVCLVGGTDVSSAFDAAKELIPQLPAEPPQASGLALADIEQVLTRLAHLMPLEKPRLLTLGEPTYLVSPNKIHHLYLKEWTQRFPLARLYAPPGLAQKRKDLCFEKELTDAPEDHWAREMDQLIFRGSLIMKEVVFFFVLHVR